jgi:hypothetical protein
MQDVWFTWLWAWKGCQDFKIVSSTVTTWTPHLTLHSGQGILPFGIWCSVHPDTFVSQVVSFPQVSPPNHICNFPNSQYVPRFSWFDHPNNIWWGTHITELVIMQSLWVPYYVVPLTPKYLPQRPYSKGPQVRFSIIAWGLVSPHNKITSIIICMYILML